MQEDGAVSGLRKQVREATGMAVPKVPRHKGGREPWWVCIASFSALDLGKEPAWSYFCSCRTEGTNTQ